MMMLLVQFALGRMVLHLCCILRVGRWDFHWAGVRREVRGMRRGGWRFAPRSGAERDDLKLSGEASGQADWNLRNGQGGLLARVPKDCAEWEHTPWRRGRGFAPAPSILLGSGCGAMSQPGQ